MSAGRSGACPRGRLRGGLRPLEEKLARPAQLYHPRCICWGGFLNRSSTLKRICVLSRNSMFGRGIETLLAQEAGVEILRSDPELLHEPVEFLKQQRPDIVIVNCDHPEPELTGALKCILQERLNISVIGLSLQDNRIFVYRGEERQVRQVDDLLAAINE